MWSAACLHRVHLCRLSRVQDLVLVLVQIVCSRLLSALSLCPRCVALEICLYSRFKGAFGVVWGCRVGLSCLGALRGLWGFCTRVELGGFGACSVFAPPLSSLLPLFCPLSCPLAPAFLACPLVLFACLVCSCGLCVFFFPFGLYAKRKGAPCWCVLSCPVMCV